MHLRFLVNHVAEEKQNIYTQTEDTNIFFKSIWFPKSDLVTSTNFAYGCLNKGHTLETLKH